MKARGLLAFAGAMMAVLPALRFNWTESMPIGLWRVSPVDQPLRRGSAILVCLPDSVADLAKRRGYIGTGDCPADAAVLLKRVGAVPGDKVVVTQSGLSVNGFPISDTSPETRDPSGRVMPRLAPGRYRVAPDEVWIIGQERLSFDSRYFGAVPSTNIIGLASPVIVERPDN